MRKQRNDLVVVGGSQPPAPPPSPPPIKWKDFKRFMAMLDELKEYSDELDNCRFNPRDDDNSQTSADLEDNAEWCQSRVAKCKAWFARFDPPDNYEPCDDDDDYSELKRSHISKRVGVMIASFPAANPGSPEGYAQMLVEHISALEGLTAVALESACREIVETKKFAPAIAEIMPIIDKHINEWRARRWAMNGVESMRLRTIEVLAERERKREQEQRDRQINDAVSMVKKSMATTRRVAWEIERKTLKIEMLMREIEAVKVERVKLVEEHTKAEQRESAALRVLRKLTINEDEQAAAAAAEADGAGCAETTRRRRHTGWRTAYLHRQAARCGGTECCLTAAPRRRRRRNAKPVTPTEVQPAASSWQRD